MKPKLQPDGRCTCGHFPQPDIIEPGYGVRKDGTTACIDCLTASQKDALERDGQGRMLLSGNRVVNEAGTLAYEITRSVEAGHNIAAIRRDLWFIGPDDMLWQGTRYGDGDGKINVKRCTGYKQLQTQLREHGMTLYLTDGEYRVNYRFGSPETTYYTNDPVDAFNTGLRMAAERDAPKPIALNF